MLKSTVNIVLVISCEPGIHCDDGFATPELIFM